MPAEWYGWSSRRSRAALRRARAVALLPLFTPAPAAVGATAQGSVAAATPVPMLSGEASALVAALVGLVTSGVVAVAALVSGSPAITGATSASVALAIGLETSGADVASALAAACGSVNEADVSGSVADAS